MKEKITQLGARYRPNSVGSAGCFNCRNFIAYEACLIVAGRIQIGGVCTQWSKREPTKLENLMGRAWRDG